MEPRHGGLSALTSKLNKKVTSHIYNIFFDKYSKIIITVLTVVTMAATSTEN